MLLLETNDKIKEMMSKENNLVDNLIPKEGFKRKDLAISFGVEDFESLNSFEKTMIHFVRMEEMKLYSVPSNETLVLLSEFLKGKKVVEICAGRGYLSYVLSNLGINIQAIDDFSWKLNDTLTNVIEKNALDAIEPDVDIYIMSWAPYENKWDLDFLNKMREINPNAMIVCIEESSTNSYEFKNEVEYVQDDLFEKITESYRLDRLLGDNILLYK